MALDAKQREHSFWYGEALREELQATVGLSFLVRIDPRPQGERVEVRPRMDSDPAWIRGIILAIRALSSGRRRCAGHIQCCTRRMTWGARVSSR